MRAKLFIVAGVVAVAAVFNPFSLYRVKGDSMSPTLEDGSIVITVNRGASLKYGDIVILKKKGKTYVKRVEGLSGDEIEFRHGYLYRNGERTSEEWDSGDTPDYSCTVEEDEVFVIGDNRKLSVDSRDYGCVDLDQIKRVVLK